MYTFKIGIDESDYDSFAVTHPLYNLLQSSKWSKIKKSWGNQRVALYKENELVGVASVLIKHLPLGFTMMYIPRGPLLDYNSKEEVAYFMAELKKWAKKQKCLFVKMDPGIHVNDYMIDELNDNKYNVDQILTNMREAGTKHLGYVNEISESIQPRFQANVYKSDEFLETLPKHTKRLIKDATKRDVHVKRVSLGELQEFSNLVELTEERKGVSLRNKEYFKLLMETYGEDCWLYLASVNISENLAQFKKEKEENDLELLELKEESRKKRNRLLDKEKSLDNYIKEMSEYEKKYGEYTAVAGVLSIRYGNTLEMLYAGMNDDFKKFMPQYHLYTQIINDAFHAGCDYSNMGGVEGSLDDGLTKFKANFNPMINEFIGEFDLPTSILYPLGKKAFEMYRKKSND